VKFVLPFSFSVYFRNLPEIEKVVFKYGVISVSKIFKSLMQAFITSCKWSKTYSSSQKLDASSPNFVQVVKKKVV